ncbi:MAG: SUMF1/EgtB/PvdO family nonheme iron enzyme, partial [Acidobacteriota bacterium]
GTSIDPKRLREKWSEIEAQIGAGKDRLLLLLDGVDELSEVQVKLTRDLALDLAPPSARVVVSSRDSGATHIFEQQRDRGFVSVGLKELDDEQRELLVRRVAGTLSSKGAELDATAFAKELGRALPEESRVPLFVTLATWLRVARGIEVGGSGRLDFLRYCVDELLFDEHRDSTRGPVSPLFKARDAGAWFARLVALHYALVGQLPDLSGTAAGWIDSAKLDNGPLSSTWRQLDAALGLQQGLKQGDDWDDDALEEIPGIDLSVKVMRGLLAALRSSALCDGDSPLQPWSHRSLGQVLVADLILAYYAKARLEALCTLTGEWIAHSGRESAARFAEIWAFVGLGIESSDDRDEWILFLAAQEKQSDLGGRAVTRGLSMGVQVRPRVAATALGVEGDWRRRHKAYGSFEPLDSEQLQELLTSLVLQVDLEQTGDETLDRRDLGWALERARAGWNGRASTRAQTAIETLIIDRLPSPDLERMRAAFGTIGGAWAETDEEQERLAEDRSMLAPLRDDPEHPVDAAPLDAPFWVDVEGTTDDEPFAIGADSDDEDAFENETPPPGGVHLSSYAISAVPVTRGLYRLFDPTHERNAQGRADEPATDLIWYEARLFCAWATHWLRHFKLLAPDEAIDLPTEAQWEFAARECGRSKGGSRFHTGRDEEDLARAGWHYGHHYLPEGPRTMPVGLLIPATIKGPDEPKIQRLWDCHGNVFEWCRDIYADELEGGEDPAGPAWQPGRGAVRVVRGGSVDFVARHCRASCRGRVGPAFGDFVIGVHGFRLVRAPSV